MIVFNFKKMNNTHRFFIQFMLHNGLVPLVNALSFLEEISPDGHSLTHLKSLIIEINREIGNQGFKIMSTVCEVTNKTVLVWITTKNDELSRQQVLLTPAELDYFHALMQEIITSDDHKLMYPRCINIASTLSSTLSRENGEKSLINWIRIGYFVKKEEFVYLGIRTILEYATYLRANTEDCSCNLCSELVFTGTNCNNCDKIFHSKCIDKYLENRHNCPNCKTGWGHENSQNRDLEESESIKRRR